MVSFFSCPYRCFDWRQRVAPLVFILFFFYLSIPTFVRFWLPPKTFRSRGHSHIQDESSTTRPDTLLVCLDPGRRVRHRHRCTDTTMWVEWFLPFFFPSASSSCCCHMFNNSSVAKERKCHFGSPSNQLWFLLSFFPWESPQWAIGQCQSLSQGEKVTGLAVSCRDVVWRLLSRLVERVARTCYRHLPTRVCRDAGEFLIDSKRKRTHTKERKDDDDDDSSAWDAQSRP